jgi:hypothetical protein
MVRYVITTHYTQMYHSINQQMNTNKGRTPSMSIAANRQIVIMVSTHVSYVDLTTEIKNNTKVVENNILVVLSYYVLVVVVFMVASVVVTRCRVAIVVVVVVVVAPTEVAIVFVVVASV